jgi:hypothetical protein
MRENIPVIRLRSKYGFLAARDGVVLCFFMRRSHHEVASAVWQALQTYRRAIPSQSLAWYVSEDGDFLPLDDKSWEHIRWKMLERSGAGACHVELTLPVVWPSLFPPSTSWSTAQDICAPWPWRSLVSCPSTSATPAWPLSLRAGAGTPYAANSSHCSLAIRGWTSTGSARRAVSSAPAPGGPTGSPA